MTYEGVLSLQVSTILLTQGRNPGSWYEGMSRPHHRQVGSSWEVSGDVDPISLVLR